MTRRSALTTPTYPFGGATAFNYDERGQMSLENSNRGAGYNHAFDYDGAGNPTTWKGASRTFNADNQETTGGNFGYNNGDGSPWQYLNRNLKSAQNPSGTKQILSYTSLGQLRQINAQNSDGSAGAALAFYGYRGDGKRAWTQNPTSGNRTYFYYSGDTLIGTAGDAANSASSVMLWGADGLIGVQSRDAQNVVRSSFFLYDAQGNLAQSVDGEGNVTPAASYTAWGEVVPRADGTTPGVGTFGYGAKFGYMRDGETGFYLCTYRHYDPSAGRWITRDPIGYAGGSNLYGYVGNDPVNLTDPYGLNPLIGGAIGATGGVLFGAGSSIASDLWNGREIDWGNAGRNALIGGVAGAVAGATFGLAMPAAGSWAASTAGGRSLLTSLVGYKIGSLSAVAGDVAGQSLALGLRWRDCYSWQQTFVAGALGGVLGGLKFEITLQNGARIAPFGNRAGHPRGIYPHWHRGKPNPANPGQNLPGQSINRHRPWDSHPSDTGWGDRF